MRFLAVLTVRNEGAFLLEWLAHHKACGFTDFLVLSNDCDDGTDTMLDRLDALGIIHHLRNDGPHEGGVQWAGLKKADKHPVVAQADWILPLDVDEFVNIHVGDRTLSALLDAIPEATAITLTWRLFGNAGVVHFEDTPVTERFTKAAPAITRWPWRANMFKTLYRNDGTYQKLGVHRPRSPDKKRLEHAKWFDGNGAPLSEMFTTRRIFSNMGQAHFGLVQLNHYPLGAMESYVLKCDRGRAVHGDDRLGMDYWVERNFCSDEDTTICAIAPLRDAELARLRTDETLVNLHENAVSWRKSRFEELMLEEPFRALFGRLVMTPVSVPVPQNAARFLISHANRARRQNN
ncbi:glycosyl transferase family 2 [Actibacterium mucosum KCTC 23349]|uniref:Glycosyl transferase family 2 n=1 Tax=Actibacterium mucosum KCTC 23349 TaxID=1454373 RepID=A0A037ZGC7_9RHOB|nr:glycosyltransferase family 2 protein [Actibacterium mucosum]KAJ55500.1 glycosyl transferase family 2 [Actibacterium mucosum KCTC 23349]